MVLNKNIKNLPKADLKSFQFLLIRNILFNKNNKLIILN